MKANIYLGAAILILQVGSTLCADIAESRKMEILKEVEADHLSDGSTSQENPFAAWIMDLTKEEKQWMIPTARKRRDHWDAEAKAVPEFGVAYRDDWNGLLAYLGDEDALRALIDRMRQSGGGLQVDHAASGRVPVYLENELFLEETFEWLGTDAPQVKQSFGIAASIVGYLHFNKNYPQEVREWAGRTERNAKETQDWTLLRSVVRKWYRANEAFIRAEQYDDAKPGEEIPPLPRIGDTGARRIDLRPPVPESSRGPAPARAPADPATLHREENRRRNSLFFAAGFAVLAGIGLFFAWRRNKHS